MPIAPRLLAAVLLLVAGGESEQGLAAPGAAAVAEPTYFESIDVDVVSVEVFVTDKHGNPILGLEAQDFTVLEDDKPVAITNFWSATAAGPSRAGQPAAAPAAAGQALAPPPSGAAAAAGRGLPGEQQLDLAVLIDNSTLTPPSRNRALRALREFLAERLERQDRVLVASWERDLRVVQEPTTDRAAVTAVLERISGQPGAGSQRTSEIRRLLEEMTGAMPPGRDPTRSFEAPDRSPDLRAAAMASIRSFAQEREQEGRAALAGLARFVDSLSGLPGRKALLYVSGGLSLRPGEALYRTFETQFAGLLSRSSVTAALQPLLESQEIDLTPLLRAVVEHANASGVTFYTLLMGDDDSGGGAGGRGSMAWTENAATEELNRRQPMLQLATDTGGAAALDPIEPAGFLTHIQHDLSACYSVGYASPHPHDGKVHRIKVKLRDPELRVRHRAAYRDRTGADRIRDRTVSALLFGIEENPLGVAIEISDERRDAKGQVLVDLLVKIPMANLVLLPGERLHRGRLTLLIGARGLQGWTSGLTTVSVPIQIENERLLTAMGQMAGYRTTLVMRPEETVLAVGVRDELSQAESTLRKTYVPGLAGAARGKEGT